jgi:DNA-binding XRE family transcriptional regulator
MYFFIDKRVLCCYHASGGTSDVVWKECYLMQDTLARKLRVLRAERGLTLREAEQLTGVDKDTLSKIERGLRHPFDVTVSRSRICSRSLLSREKMKPRRRGRRE